MMGTVECGGHTNPITAENGRTGTCFATSELGNAVAVALGQERLLWPTLTTISMSVGKKTLGDDASHVLFTEASDRKKLSLSKSMAVPTLLIDYLRKSTC